MKKRFTLLFAALLAFVGVAKADFQLTYSRDAAFWGSTLTEYPTEIAGILASESFTSAAVRCHDEAVVVTGDVTVVFEHVNGKGDHKQHILGVVLKNAEGVVEDDYHYGTHPGSNNTYTLSGVEAGEYTLSMYVSNNGTDNVNNFGGTITVTGAKIHAASGVVTSIEDLSNDKLYAIVPKDNTRGALYATSASSYLDACGGTANRAANPGVQIDATSADQQFAIYKHNEVMYLYSVGAGKFVSDISGNLFPLVETPRHNIALEVSAEAGYFIIKAKGSEFINVSTGHASGCVAGWNQVDDGNKLQITEVAAMPEATLTQLKNAFAAAEAALLPEVSTDEAPKYYTIGSYDRGGFLTNMGSGKGVHHVAATTNSLWYFTKANDNGGVYVCNKNGGYLAANRTVSEEKAVWYVLSNGVNLQGAVISSTKPISGGSCIDANNTNTGVGSYAPSASDWKGTTWVFVESNVVTYKFAYGDKVVAKEVITAKGGAYPDYGLPYGLVAAQAKPEGVVDGDKEVAVDVSFSFPVSDENSTKAVMIGAHNNEALLWRAVENGVTVQKDATANSANYYWAIYPTFAENSLNYTVTIKNLGTGKYIYSTSDADSHDEGVVTLADEGSVFTLESANQFKLATGKYLSINSATYADVQLLGTHTSHGGTKNKFVAYPGLDEEIKAAFMEQVEACSSLYENYEEALEKLEALDGKMEELLAVVEPIYDAIEAGDFVKEATVEAATESMVTVKDEVEPVLVYYNGDYKTAADKAKAFCGKFDEESEAYTALAAAIATFEEVADVTTVEALEAKVAALNTVYDEQYAAYDLSEVKETFATQVEAFAELGKDEAFDVLLAIKEQYTTTKGSVDALAAKIAANELVLKSEVQDAMGMMESFQYVIMEYNENYAALVAEAQGFLAQLKEGSEDYEYLAGAIAEFEYVTPENGFMMAAYMVNQAVNNLCDIDESFSVGEQGWVDANAGEYPVIKNAGLTEEWEGGADYWTAANGEIVEVEREDETVEEISAEGTIEYDFENGVVTFVATEAQFGVEGENYTKAYLKQGASFDPGEYYLIGKAYAKGVTNAVMFVSNAMTGDIIRKCPIPVVEGEASLDECVLEFDFTVEGDQWGGPEYLSVGYSCEFENVGDELVVGGFRLEVYANETSTLREEFQKVYQGNMMMGEMGFNMLKYMEPNCYLEAMHPAYDALFEEVGVLYDAMYEGKVLKVKVEKAIADMKAMIAKFDAVANCLMGDEYFVLTDSAATIRDGYYEESNAYALLDEALLAAMGVVLEEDEVDGEVVVTPKYYAAFTSLADVEEALEDLEAAITTALAQVPDTIYLDIKKAELSDDQRTIQLTATVEAESENADKSVFWESDDEEVATVDENGLVTAVAEGTAYITAYSIHKKYYAECEVTVTALTDGIDNFEVKVETVIYDIHGRRVEKMEKGFYIVNGKKVLVK